MNITFINLSLRPNSARRQFPLGLAYVMTAVEKAGYEFNLIDMDIDNYVIDDVIKILSTTYSDVIAFGCIVTGFSIVKEISIKIKSINSECKIVVGNAVGTSISEVLLANTKVDFAVVGEGDITFVELLRAIENQTDINNVKGIAFYKNGKYIYTGDRPLIQNLDSIGFPNWNHFEIEKYKKFMSVNVDNYSQESVVSFPITISRGCPYNCTFCYHVFKGKQYRRYSDEYFIAEIQRLHSEFNCNYLLFWDELTFPTIRSVENIINKIEKLDFQIKWQAIVRGNLFNQSSKKLLQRMKKAGCTTIAYSLESGNRKILSAMNKKLLIPEFIEQTKVIWEAGLIPMVSVLFGYPQETPETIAQTIKVCEVCSIYPSAGYLLPLPGTPIYDWARKNNYILNEVKYLEKINDRQNFHINLTKMSDAEFIYTVSSNLEKLARKQNIELSSIFKDVLESKNWGESINKNKIECGKNNGNSNIAT